MVMKRRRMLITRKRRRMTRREIRKKTSRNKSKKSTCGSLCILYFYWVHSIGVWVFVRFLEPLFPTDVLYITESFLYPILIKSGRGFIYSLKLLCDYHLWPN
jgi:hypothetical protein